MDKQNEQPTESNPLEHVVMYTCYGCGIEDGYGNNNTQIRRDRVVGSYISFNCKHCNKQNNVT